jgi:hypothetical protein
MRAPEIIEYPETGKVMARTFPPGSTAPEDAVDLFVASDHQRADYFDSES